MSRNWHGYVKLAGILAVVAAIIYWANFRPIAVVSHPVRRTNVAAEVMGTGTLEARVSTSISPKINGRIVAVSVDQGDRVAAEDQLVQLDDDEYKQQVEIARATLAARAAAIERLKSDRARTEAVYEQAKTEYDRSSRLEPAQAISASALDKAGEALAIAQAGLAHSEAAMAEAQEELVVAEKSLDYQQSLLANTIVRAPFDGLIVARQREPGDVVVPGSAILTLISTEELWINAWVDETEMARLSAGQSACVIFRSESNKSYCGKVARLGKQADRETREFVVDVSVLELPENWAVGQRADVYIEVAHKPSTMAIPPEAVVWRRDQDGTVAGVYVSNGGKAIWKAIALGLHSRELVEVLDGVQTSDVIVVPENNQEALTDGVRIMAR